MDRLEQRNWEWLGRLAAAMSEADRVAASAAEELPQREQAARQRLAAELRNDAAACEVVAKAVAEAQAELASRGLADLMPAPQPVELPPGADGDAIRQGAVAVAGEVPGKLRSMLKYWDTRREEWARQRAQELQKQQRLWGSLIRWTIWIVLFGFVAVVGYNMVTGTLDMLNSLVGSPAASSQASGPPLASLADTRWFGQFDGQPAGLLLLRRGDGLMQAVLHTGAGVETLTPSGSGSRFTLQGISGHYRCDGWPGKWPLDTLQGQVSADGKKLSGTYRDEAGSAGSWEFTRVAEADADLTGRWEGHYLQDGARTNFSLQLFTVGNNLLGCSVETVRGQTVRAVLGGRVDGKAVSWVKRMRLEHQDWSPANYSGTWEGKSASGRWQIAGTSETGTWQTSRSGS